MPYARYRKNGLFFSIDSDYRDCGDKRQDVSSDPTRSF
ncbi:hypothetical protein EIO_2940 (plasmid) [Ketogulonicigenium vulgare Y25]|uniref:Uncharacterized protein n=1 Tax=Ketogulonicigenium vulgare (strain WSH-001) TaxID=759362 RepID=F9YAY3_KETVW|nr:hypothetical protein EIO_2940 [Ketogulonicigenium vulgare Y25]AEM42535.1 hypothetical protein KVU_PA0115 [Ketogulonicigenium vulgare WSH-001]ALJ82569.1 hypothetical protein KVH_14810 [Ketogulonicigenium vulgare]